MHLNHKTLETFYTAFAVLDADTMASCYAADARFDDEVFSLRGHQEVAGMWRMLCSVTQAKGRDVWRLTYSGLAADAQRGRAHWEAYYRFSTTGRMVHNSIDGEFEFNAAGQIVVHRDHFNFWRWSRQALGAPGLLLGWTPMLRSKVRAQAQANLQKFLAAR
ncbi:nuclear transport factor 2 family protein [Variovorax sp. HJSM1_2]|uniref:nuclear transport factor 2 family protein n=1 Tax=Variovorax sp. HJSM1_2 TaxID=3366263 RepID=UPI003BD18A98